MTETQNHRRPLAPGEIRTHTVGARTFTVMHVAGGSFTQASVREAGKPPLVLATAMDESLAVRAYADAIDAAEGDAIDADEDWAAPMFIGAASGKLVTPGAEVPANGLVGLLSALAATFGGTIRESADALVTPGADGNCGPRAGGGWTCHPAACDRPGECILPGAPEEKTAAELHPTRESVVLRRATDATGRGVWQHACGNVRVWDAGPSINMSCSWCYKTGAWRALYTIGDTQ